MTRARYATYLGVANAMDDWGHSGEDKDKSIQQARGLVSSCRQVRGWKDPGGASYRKVGQRGEERRLVLQIAC